MLLVEWFIVVYVIATLAMQGGVVQRRQAPIRLALVGSAVPPRGDNRL